MRAILYARLSSADDASTSITRQVDDLRAWVEREGGEVVAQLVDDGVSGRKARANAAEALRLIREGEGDALVVWKLDRWSRQGLRAVSDLIEALDANPGARFVALRDGLDSTTPTWRIIASVLSEVARIEAENTSARNRSSRAHLPRVGRFAGGTVPYGYRAAPADDGVGRVLQPHPTEAAEVRQAAERLLDGASVGSVVRDWQQRGLPTARSAFRSAREAGRPTDGLDRGTWHTVSVRRLLTSDHLLGRVTEWGAREGRNRPRVLRDADGRPLAPFEPVLDLATLTRLRARLGTLDDEPRAVRVKPGRMLSGLAYCGLCGRKLYVRGGQARPAYRCSVAGAADCPGVQVDAVKLEDFVASRYLSAVGHAEEVERTEVVLSDPSADELADVEQRLRELTADLLDDDSDEALIMRRLAGLKARRAELRSMKPEVETFYSKTGRTLAEAWEATMTTAERLAFLSEAIDHLDVRPSKGPRGRGPLAADRVSIYWTS